MIEDSLQVYLFQHKKCPLPHLGTLELVDGNATAWHTEKKMMAPVPFILFSHTESDNADLVAYLSAESGISLTEANQQLQEFCRKITDLKPDQEFDLPSAGTFFVETDGKLAFRQHALPHEYFQEVPLNRVVRQDAVHQMTVGDTHTDSQQMTEYYQEQANVKKERWWISAAAILIVSAAAFLYYMSDNRRSATFGHAGQLVPKSETPTYSIPK